MRKQLILAVCFSFIYQTSFADTCPSINDIKRRALTNWNIYDAEDGVKLSDQRLAHFIQHAANFSLAEWDGQINKNKSGAIHCYYRDKHGSDLEAYIAKDNFIPLDAKKYWYEVSGAKHCAAGMQECQFQSVGLPHNQLAKR